MKTNVEPRDFHVLAGAKVKLERTKRIVETIIACLADAPPTGTAPMKAS